MEFCHFYISVFAAMTLTAFVSARGVNISNTWMLPEEGFPVFFRHFRDRISWYEADAVCQFHHANLVTADTTSQYDAIRAYLKELDITENIWIGLSRPTERPNFMWTNFHPLNGEGHWQQAIPKSIEPMCAAMDPAADFLWKAKTCGGPDVASFICELPVPSWAMGSKGCLFTELPSLTVLYIPEQLALELTSDCGLDGTKRIACKGNADREDILKQLTCAMSPDDFDEKSTKSPVSSNTVSSSSDTEDIFANSKTTKPWIWTSNTVDIDYGMPTRHRRETEDTLSPSSTKSTTDLSVESRNKSKLKTTASPTENTSSIEDVTLDMIVSAKSDKPKIELTTEMANGEQEEIFGSVETKTVDSEIEDTGEYPSAIGQGQLFSIIENGTMFDIIEVNDTTSNDMNLGKDVMMETPQSQTEILKTSTDQANENLYTTVVYHKEPPSETSFVTNKSVKKTDSQSKKYKDKETRKDKPHHKNFEQQNNKTTNKEVDLFSLATDSLVKLNRTFRKEVPPMDENFNTSAVNSTEDKNHHVEVKWHDQSNNLVKLFVTTRTDPLKTISDEDFIKNVTDIFTTQKPKIVKKEFLRENKIDEEEVLNGGGAAEPEPQPRPNRQRQLTRPQRRSFYPYFFSRVLG